MTRDTYLEITYRHGRPLAAYLYLGNSGEVAAARSQKVAPGLVVDYAEDDQPIGIEITSPSTVSTTAINDVLASLHQRTLEDDELAPLLAG